MLSSQERRVVESVDDQQVRQWLRELVAIPSVDGSAAEVDVQAWCAAQLKGLGLLVDHWRIDLAALRDVDGFPGTEVDRDQAWGCAGSWSGTGAPALVFNGHVDVVPSGDPGSWPDRDPFTVRETKGACWGRGTCDMKGGVAAVLGAVAALRRAGVHLRRPLAVHTVVGEEDGGIGAFATLRRGHIGHACVIAEPTAGEVVPANAGSLTFRLRVTGSATHGSTRTRGVSAVEKFEVVHAALRRLETERNAVRDPLFAHLDLVAPLSVGIVSAGDWASTVPDRLLAEGRYGVLPGESLEDARAEFETAVSQACSGDSWLSSHSVTVEWPGGAFASGRLPAGHPLLGQVRAVVTDVSGAQPPVRGAPYGSDLRHYAAAGVPTVQYGPGDVRHAHALDEHVPIADLARCTRVYAVLALRLCG